MFYLLAGAINYQPKCFNYIANHLRNDYYYLNVDIIIMHQTIQQYHYLLLRFFNFWVFQKQLANIF